MSSGALVAAASGLDGCVPAPDALTVWLVLPADLPDGSADAFADMCAPCPELTVGGGCRWWLGVEDVLGVFLEQRIEGGARAEVAGWSGGRLFSSPGMSSLRAAGSAATQPPIVGTATSWGGGSRRPRILRTEALPPIRPWFSQ